MNEFTLVLIIIPLITVLLSVVDTLLSKRFYVMPLLTFVLLITLTYTVFNGTFIVWAIVNTILSCVTSALVRIVAKVRFAS